jgi:transposase
MAITLPDARQLSDEVLEALRVRALHGRELGFTEADIADLLGISRETVSRWYPASTQGGLEAAPHDRSGRPPGSGRLLTDAQAHALQDLIDHHSPEQVNVPAPLWNRRAVQQLIKQELGIDMPIRTVGAYLRRWGDTAKRPRRHSRDQDPEEVKRWLAQTYPAIAARAEEEGAEIHWGDECGVAADEHPGYGSARQGQRATMEVPDSHIRVKVISTVTNAGGLRFRTHLGKMSGAPFIVFLRRLIAGGRRKVFLIVDQLRAHWSGAVRAWVAAHPEEIELLELPTHSRELNADEYLNNDLKGGVSARGLPSSKGELRSRIQSYLHRLAQLPERVMSYFQHPCVQYAADQ